MVCRSDPATVAFSPICGKSAGSPQLCWRIWWRCWLTPIQPRAEHPQIHGPRWNAPTRLRELADVIAEPLSIIFDRSWRTGEVPKDWRKASVTPIFKKGKKEDPGNYCYRLDAVLCSLLWATLLWQEGWTR